MGKGDGAECALQGRAAGRREADRAARNGRGRRRHWKLPRSLRGRGRADPLSGGICLCRTSKQSPQRSEEHTSELQSLMRISYAVFCLKKKKRNKNTKTKQIKEHQSKKNSIKQ